MCAAEINRGWNIHMCSNRKCKRSIVTMADYTDIRELSVSLDFKLLPERHKED